MKEITKEELKKYSNGHCLTVGRLKEFLNKYDFPDDAPVVIERVQDVYYEKNGWDVYLKPNEHTEYAEQWNRDIESGKYLDKSQYPLMEEEMLIPYTEEEIKNSMSQYHPAWSCVHYEDDKDILFIDLHY